MKEEERNSLRNHRGHREHRKIKPQKTQKMKPRLTSEEGKS